MTMPYATTLQDALAHIEPADKDAMAAARARWNSLAKPVGGLGMFEDLVVQIAGIVGTSDVRPRARELIVTCADNGVVRQGVSASDASVTRVMARAIAAGKSTAACMARRAGCSVTCVDVGMLEGPPIPGVRMCAVRPGGTDDITSGPAMDPDECLRAIELGINLVAEHKQLKGDVPLSVENSQKGIPPLRCSWARWASATRPRPVPWRARFVGKSRRHSWVRARGFPRRVSRERSMP